MGGESIGSKSENKLFVKINVIMKITHSQAVAAAKVFPVVQAATAADVPTHAAVVLVDTAVVAGEDDFDAAAVFAVQYNVHHLQFVLLGNFPQLLP